MEDGKDLIREEALQQSDHIADGGTRDDHLREVTKKMDTISRQAAIKTINKVWDVCDMESLDDYRDLLVECFEVMPPAQPEIVRCCKCSYWDRDSLRHQCNDFRDWNEAECKILAERDPYDEINRYTEADDYCSRAERRTDETDY